MRLVSFFCDSISTSVFLLLYYYELLLFTIEITLAKILLCDFKI